jgi:hypothetical protein
MVIMAIDSRDKRFSVIGFGSPVPSALPLPDSTISASDRAMLAWLYFGLSIGAPIVGITTLLVFKVKVDDIVVFNTEVDDIVTFDTEVDDIITFEVSV